MPFSSAIKIPIAALSTRQYNYRKVVCQAIKLMNEIHSIAAILGRTGSKRLLFEAKHDDRSNDRQIELDSDLKVIYISVPVKIKGIGC
jgi:hypothetical protein